MSIRAVLETKKHEHRHSIGHGDTIILESLGHNMVEMQQSINIYL